MRRRARWGPSCEGRCREHGQKRPGADCRHSAPSGAGACPTPWAGGRVHRVGEGNFIPAEAWLAEADLDFRSDPLAVQQAAGTCRSLLAPVSSMTQRVAFPQLSTSPPSPFQIRIRRSAIVAGVEDDQLVAADAGAPVSDRAHELLRDDERLFACVEITKSLPSPCILWKWRCIGRDLGSVPTVSPPRGTCREPPTTLCNRSSFQRCSTGSPP